MKTFYRYIIPVLIILIGFVFIIIDKDNQHMHLKAFKSSKYKDIEYRDVQLDTMRAKVLIKFNNEQRLQTFIPLTSDETKMLQFSTLLIYDDSLGYQNIIMLSDWFPSDITQKCLSEIGAPLLKQLCGSILYLRPNDENSIIRAIKLNKLGVVKAIYLYNNMYFSFKEDPLDEKRLYSSPTASSINLLIEQGEAYAKVFDCDLDDAESYAYKHYKSAVNSIKNDTLCVVAISKWPIYQPMQHQKIGDFLYYKNSYFKIIGYTVITLGCIIFIFLFFYFKHK